MMLIISSILAYGIQAETVKIQYRRKIECTPLEGGTYEKCNAECSPRNPDCYYGSEAASPDQHCYCYTAQPLKQESVERTANVIKCTPLEGGNYDQCNEDCYFGNPDCYYGNGAAKPGQHCYCWTDSTCGENAEFKMCSGCEQACDQDFIIRCPAICQAPKCQCKNGFVRGPNGNCIRKDECPVVPDAKCGENAEFRMCSGCELACNQEPTPCPQMCQAPKCQCKYGFVRGPNGNCIGKDECPIAPDFNPCKSGEPLQDALGVKLHCGRGKGRVDCPNGSTCNISPTDRYAVCCPVITTTAATVKNTIVKRRLIMLEDDCHGMVIGGLIIVSVIIGAFIGFCYRQKQQSVSLLSSVDHIEVV